MNFPSLSTAGIETYQPAVLFAVLYTALACLYVRETARNPTHTFVVLVIFCVCKSLLCTADRRAQLSKAVRIVGFILRAILAASDGAKENAGLVISETIFFSLGFVGLLYSVFLLISDRSILAPFR